MIYLTFIGGVSGDYYKEEFKDIREAEIFRQCFQSYIKCGRGTYNTLRICKVLPLPENMYINAHNRDDVYRFCKDVIWRFHGLI